MAPRVLFSSHANLMWTCTWSGVGKFTKISAGLCCFKSMGLIFRACWPEAVLHWLNPRGARAVNWLAEDQLRRGVLCVMADTKSSKSCFSWPHVAPGLLEAWKESSLLLLSAWPGFVKLSCALGESASRFCSCLYRWGLFPDSQLRIGLGNCGKSIWTEQEGM